MALTLRQIVSDAMENFGELGQGQTANNDEVLRGMREANRIIGRWSAERLLNYKQSTRVYAVSSGEFTIGPSGTLSGTLNGSAIATRPAFIESASIVSGFGGPRTPLKMATRAEWDAILTKDAVASVAERIFVEYSFPDIRVRLNPAPTGATLYLGCLEAFTPFATITTTFDHPPGYEELLINELTVVLAKAYTKPVTQDMVAAINESRQAIMERNAMTLYGDMGTVRAPNLSGPPQAQPTGQ